MNDLSYQLFASARFAGCRHRNSGARHFTNQLAHALHARVLTYEQASGCSPSWALAEAREMVEYRRKR